MEKRFQVMLRETEPRGEEARNKRIRQQTETPTGKTGEERRQQDWSRDKVVKTNYAVT